MSLSLDQVAGRLKHFVQEWEIITSDPVILDSVQHCHIDFVDNEIPVQKQISGNILFSSKEKEIIDLEIDKLKLKGVIEETFHSDGEFISPIFLRRKKDNSYRLILNLKEFNQNVEYYHFKMENLQHAIRLMQKGCFMASMDLKDAYYSVPFAKEHRKYLRFRWNGKLFQFTCLPNGLSIGPRRFTKILKPVYAYLRKMGHVNVGYIDDSFLQGETFEECKQNVSDTVDLFSTLGFLIHPTKSVLEPCQEIMFLGFVLNSILMHVSLPPDKAAYIRQKCLQVLRKAKLRIQELAEVIGIIVAAFPGVEYGPMHYRELERDKTVALTRCKGNYQALVCLSPESRTDLEWWVRNVQCSYKMISHGKPQVILHTDTSKLGWGCECEGLRSGGRWTINESEEHINCLELKAVLFALKSLHFKLTSKHVEVQVDNTTAVAYIRAFGGTTSRVCDQITKNIWQFCIEKDIWLSVSYLPGVENVLADYESRQFDDNKEWQLSTKVFNKLCETFGHFDIDLFASRLNKQLATFVSWRPDPEAFRVDAFSIS